MAKPKSNPMLKTLLLCRYCGERKGPEAYTPSEWRKYITSGECRACRKKYSSQRYGRIAGQMSTNRIDRLAIVHAIKSARGCRDCGEKHPACLDFHHRNPAEKKYSIGALTCGQATMQTLLAEIAKCDVLCSNCHRKHHWEEKRVERSDPKVIPLRATA